MFTKLRNPFHISGFLGFLAILLTACGSNRETQGITSNHPLLGHWTIVNISNAQTNALDSAQKAIYQNEMQQLIDSSFLTIEQDSSYHLQIGPETEEGIWLATAKMDRLVLKSKSERISRYKILSQSTNQLELLSMDEPHAVTMLLKK